MRNATVTPQRFRKILASLLPAVCFWAGNASAQDFRLAFDPAEVLPEIAVETSWGVAVKKHSVLNGKRIANSLSLTTGKQNRIGVLRYRNELGKSRYGLGYRRLMGAHTLDSIINNDGVMFAIERNKTLFNFHMKTHEPERDRESVYFQFSIMGNL